MFVQQLFDAHPEIIGYPAQSGVYTRDLPERYPSFEAAYADLVRFGDLRRHLEGRPDLAFGKLAEPFKIDARRFRALLREELSAETRVTRRDLVVAIARASARLAGRSPDRARVLLEHVHLPRSVDAALADFAGARVLHVVREPAAALYGAVRQYRDAFGANDARRFHVFMDEFMLRAWALLASAPASQQDERYRVVRIEDINARGLPAVHELADWMGVSREPSLAFPTLAGKSSSEAWGAPAGQPAFRAGSERSGAEAWGWVDAVRAEWLFGPLAERFGYAPDGDLPRWKRALGPLTPLVPIRGQLSWNYRAHVRCSRYQMGYLPIVDLAADAIAARGLVLARAVDAVGLRDASSPARRLVEASLPHVAAVKKVVFDQWFYYACGSLKQFVFRARAARPSSVAAPATPGASGTRRGARHRR
jgi:hypothetical protein